MKYVLVLLLVAAVIFWLGARWGFGRGQVRARFAPVSQLPVEVQQRIDTALRAGDRGGAAQVYRAATGASAAEARAAIETYAARAAR